MKARYAASILIAVLLSVGASGCAFITPQATLDIVETANGVNGNVGNDMAVRNATLISDDGKTARLLVSLVNTSDQGIQVNVQYKTAAEVPFTAKIDVGAGQTVTLGNTDGAQLVFTNLEISAGSLFPVYFQYGTETGTELLVPVLTSDWQEYRGLPRAVTAAPGS